MSAKAATPAIRVTVEADDSAEDEEVEDIGDCETASTASSDSEQQQQRKGGAKKRQSEASGAAGLANVIRGLLAKSTPGVGIGCPILAKALTDRQRFSPAAAATTAGGDGVDAGDDEEGDGGGVISTARRRRLTSERRRWLCAGRVKPTPAGAAGAGPERDAERELQRTACRGVVQLFNAVKAQQRSLEARLVGKSESGRQRVLASLSKADFLDMLAGRKKRQPPEDRGKVGGGDADEDEKESGRGGRAAAKKAKKSWGVLSEDYLVKPTLTMKDWDKASSSEGSAGGDGDQAMEAELSE